MPDSPSSSREINSAAEGADQVSVAQLIERIAADFGAAGLFYGHGTDNPRDEAAALVFHVLDLDHWGSPQQYEMPVARAQQRAAVQIARQRISSRMPLAYILGEAWLGGLQFSVDPRVLVPRSPVAELIAARFAPWVAPDDVATIVDIGTGSGCLAILAARQFPDADVSATDISADALAVAAVNIERHGLAGRIELLEADLLTGLAGEFDVIMSNPPYVPEGERPQLPPEYGYEPGLGLFSGSDGLDSARRILQDAPPLLSPQGILVLEVGAYWRELDAAFPDIPFTWLEFEQGGEGVAVVTAEDLRSRV